MDVPAGRFEIGAEMVGLRIGRRIGSGGWGVVYQAEDLMLKRDVAVKVVYAAGPGNHHALRFLREIQLHASVDHPGVLPVYRAEVDGDYGFIVMRLVRGGSLRDWLDSGARLTAHAAVHLLGQVAEALDELHTRGLVHRDVKPGNILVEGPPGRETVFLADFGLVHHPDVASLTSSGVGVGTFDYMAPEQRLGAGVDSHADVYSLGLVLYEALTGFLPDVADRDPLPPLRLNGADEGAALGLVCQRALARRPDDRFASAGALIAAARNTIGEKLVPSEAPRSSGSWFPPPSTSVGPAAEPARQHGRRRWWLWPSAGGVLVVLAAAAVWALTGPKADVEVNSAATPPATIAAVQYVVCADDLELRRDPLTQKQTSRVGVLHRNDPFVATYLDDRWAYGHSGEQYGWVLRQWLRRSCPAPTPSRLG